MTRDIPNLTPKRKDTEMKIIFIDIDDTLLTRDKKITPENKLAIQKVLETGNKAVICTGRPLAAALPIVEELGLTREGCYIIAFNGSVIYDCYHKKNLVRETLNMDQVRYLFAASKKAGVHVQTYDEEDTVLTWKEDEEIISYCSRINVPFKTDPNLPDSLTSDPVKVLMIDLHNHARIEAFRKSIEDWAKGEGKINLFFSNPWYLECVKAGISKGTAIHWFCDALNVPIENTIGCGDSENDLSMIRETGIGCAMANAVDSCKEAADYVTENDCDHSGVAEIIEKFILN